MISTNQKKPDDQRVVITGIGLTAPNGNSIAEYRESLLVKEVSITQGGSTGRVNATVRLAQAG